MDWDSDGDNDLLVGENNGQIRYYQNIGTAANPSLHYVGPLQAGGVTLDVGLYSTVWTDDWDEDGLEDVIAGCSDGYVKYYRNTGTAGNPVLAPAQNLTLATGGVLDVGSRSCPNVADYDGDGIKDVAAGEINGKIYFYKNNGSNYNPQLAAGVYLNTGNVQLKTMSTCRISSADWDGDGDFDIVAGSWDTRLRLFKRTDTSVPTPVCDVALTGGSPIPAGGGTLYFNFSGNNSSGQTTNFDAWTCESPMSSGNYGPFTPVLFQRTGLSLPAGNVLTRNIGQNIPGSAVSGSHYFYGHLGNLAQNQVYSWDYFTFSKSTYDSGDPLVHDWACSGWDCDPQWHQPATLPAALALAAAPNPFNPVTTLDLQLPASGPVHVGVYDVAGRPVATLVDGWREAGAHTVTWDASGLPSGLYLAKIQAGNSCQVVKLTLLK
ncbi:MAG: T9SS C-terminal target domain-containing protein [Candidatus Zixiibacteriota bacterium]|nr:MAG: T9SS C-terminal target domain-containing protein [candidate division Zixibacteria bacterium]